MTHAYVFKNCLFLDMICMLFLQIMWKQAVAANAQFKAVSNTMLQADLGIVTGEAMYYETVVIKIYSENLT